MSDTKEARVEQQGSLEDEEWMISGTKCSVKGSGFRPRFRFNGFAGCMGHHHVPWILHSLSFVILAVFLVAVLIQVSRISSSQRQEKFKEEKIYQELTQLKAEVHDSLCRPCPWEWTLFQRNCYFFSKSQRDWHTSLTACQEMGSQLVIIKTDEEQSFLQLTSKTKGPTWLGLSDLDSENKWHWVDDSPLSSSFKKYWNIGEPNNAGEEDCVEFSGDGWNDARCNTKKFWVCKKSSIPCATSGQSPTHV